MEKEEQGKKLGRKFSVVRTGEDGRQYTLRRRLPPSPESPAQAEARMTQGQASAGAFEPLAAEEFEGELRVGEMDPRDFSFPSPDGQDGPTEEGASGEAKKSEGGRFRKSRRKKSRRGRSRRRKTRRIRR